ncbi:hypothetical protein [Paragemmobacter straminiformis]|uniref:Uncharacterized protein n=1 Tax=Paragemmobacter straminiformis TaxID=2045119 RepID=A0A842I754_9RHOB|nr:hypothetical protein [Gemmobacter straminiformis]MBC2835207.1 hypothetical protein [Gemmobacter straminiformis]
MRGQEHPVETGLNGLALAVLRAEMEALSLLLPGAFAPARDIGAEDGAQAEARAEAQAEDMFENMPL